MMAGTMTLLLLLLLLMMMMLLITISRFHKRGCGERRAAGKKYAG
jgi:hypothetical protein